MLKIRMARASDEEAISRLLEELELMRQSLSMSGFWVAEEEGEIAGIAHVEEAGDAVFLSSVGVKKDRQRHGIASLLLKEIFAASGRDVYLYTVIPDFFRRLGFSEVSEPQGLPDRGLFGCDACEPGRCVCMMRPAGVYGA